MSSTHRFLSLGPHGFHRVAYQMRGPEASADTVVCVHGLTRNAHDFDFLAEALAARVRVACPDIAGRGDSDWLPVKEDYGYPLYAADMAAFLAHLGAHLGPHAETGAVDWIGTSMGGLIGLILAAQPNTPIRRLVLNDIGPFIPKAALARILDYVGADPRFASEAEAEAALRVRHAGFGPLTDSQWAYLAHHSVRARPEGGLGLAYDPGIAVALKAAPLEDVALWPLWEAVRCPVLVLRGQESDLLLPETAAQMAKKATVVVIAGCGHAPSLMAPDQIALIADWLGLS